MATSLVEYYVRGFGPESLFGLRLIISWTSGFVFLWMLGLAYLVWRANSNAMENRFMSVLLICEGIKATFIMTDAIPYESDWEWIWDYLLWIKIDLFFMAHLTAVALYFCIPIYYRVGSLSFLYKEKLQKHAWYLAPIVGILLWFSISGNQLFDIQKSAWLICTEAGATPYLQEWFGGIPEVGPEAVAAIGTCPAYLNIHISQEPLGLWAIALMSPLISIIALLFYRSSMKEHMKGDNPDLQKSLTSRSLYIGFLGKVISNMIYFSNVILIIPLLNGGPAGFIDASIWQWGADPDFMTRLKYFVWTFGLIFVPLGMGFEALMFVHASLKDTVFGIDKTLRKTFSTAVFTGIGATLFILGSEAMENALGFGMAGGVLIGVGLLAVRRPVIGLIDGFSDRLIPSEFSPEETEYLKLFSKSMKDGSVTENERELLVTLASAYGIEDDRVKQIEASFSDENSDSIVSEEVILTLEVIQQWTDDTGFTWRKMSDDSVQWWNGIEWIDYQ